MRQIRTKRHVRQRQCERHRAGKKCTAGSLIISFYDANAALVGGCKSRGKWVLLRARNKFVGLGEKQKKCTTTAESVNCGSCFFARPV
jgi:hypothetical protein